jgi:hypothetical protein
LRKNTFWLKEVFSYIQTFLKPLWSFIDYVCNIVFLETARKVNCLAVNFTNILCAAFTPPDPKIPKMIVKSSVSFACLGSTRVKAAFKTLLKSTQAYPGSQTVLSNVRPAHHFCRIFNKFMNPNFQIFFSKIHDEKILRKYSKKNFDKKIDALLHFRLIILPPSEKVKKTEPSIKHVYLRNIISFLQI